MLVGNEFRDRLSEAGKSGHSTKEPISNKIEIRKHILIHHSSFDPLFHASIANLAKSLDSCSGLLYFRIKP